MRLDVDKFLEDVTGRYASRYAWAIDALIVAMARRNRAQAEDARAVLAKVITETMGVGEVVGATIVLQQAAAVMLEEQGAARMGADTRRMVAFAADPMQTLLPNVTFAEAVKDLVVRVPAVIREPAERTAKEIARLYSQGHVVAFARSAELAVTERVQALLAQAMREGLDEVRAGELIRMSVDTIRTETAPWTEAYARMAFRTNLNTAVTAGRFRQSQDSAVRVVVPAFRFHAIGDSDTRDNHLRADGMILAVDNPAWNQIAPPLGYNCRCTVVAVTRPELRRMGRLQPDGSIRQDAVPAGAFPDEGFRHGPRPDLGIRAGVA